MGGGSPDGVPVHQLIADLLSIKLGDRRSAVLGAQKTLQDTGVLPLAVAKMLRSMYSSNHAKIRAVYEARERARVSVALESIQKTRMELEAEASAKAQVELRRKNDLGF
jgi:hypothetical protein